MNIARAPRVLGHYVRDEGVLELEDAVRKMTSLPAQVLGIADRGQVRAGSVADVTLFDPDGIAETNSFENPKSYPVGIPYVIVNGTLVIDGGEHTGARPGGPVSDGAGGVLRGGRSRRDWPAAAVGDLRSVLSSIDKRSCHLV